MTTATAIILDALDDVNVDALVTKKHAEQLAAELATALEARGYAIRKKAKPRKAEPAEPFAPNTGDAALDEFMRAHHRPDWRDRMKKATARTRPGMMPMPTPAPGHAPIGLSQVERANLWRDHDVVQHSA